jgi:hypothetical protein
MDIESLAHNLFGYKINEREFRKRFEQCPDNEILQRVTTRLRLIDLLQFRMAYRHGAFLDGTQQYLIDIDIKSLELYLLCTCIDTLSGETNFLDFPRWLQVGEKVSKKTKYHINDDKIKAILEEGKQDLFDPDVFRNKAAKVYTEIYLSNFGITNGFLQFFDELPDIAKEILASSYFISDLIKEDRLSDEIDEVTEIEGEKGWTKYSISLIKEEEKWNNKNVNDKVNTIGLYFYRHRRNAYTHKSLGWKPQVFNNPNEATQLSNILENHDTNWTPFEIKIAENDKYRFFRFKANHNEDEVLLVRLIVSISVLAKLGYDISADYVRGLRRYLFFKQTLHGVLSDFDAIFNILRYFEAEIEEPLVIRYNIGFALFPTANLKRWIPHTFEIWPNHKSWLTQYFNNLEEYNVIISEFNTKYLQLFEDNEIERTNFRKDNFEKLKHGFRVNKFFKITQKIYEWINEIADRMDW